MPHALMIIAQQVFRDEEYTEPKAILESSGVNVTTASRTAGTAEGKLGMVATVDVGLADVDPEEYDAVVFIGDAKLRNGTIDTSEQGFCWTIGKGRMFYFQAGHETNPVFFDKNVRKIMANAVKWAGPKKK